MVFSGLTFLLLFLPLLCACYFIGKSMRWRNAVLVLFSLVFYAWGEPTLILVMLFTTLANFLSALAIGKYENKAVKTFFLVFGVGVSLLALVYFKYAGFLLELLGSVLNVPISFDAPTLPIGISFYTFQILTYTIDVYRGKVKVQKNPFRLLLYVSCFPQLIAGPIVQYGDVEPMLSERTTTLEDFTLGMRRFAVGLFKKVMFANICGLALENCTLGTEQMSVVGAWLAALLYTLQLYFDFSAYSDMAIGLGRVFGFHYKENFNYPYCSTSPSEFWRRWHISLGSFFREYLYIPLGGNRKGAFRTILNLFIVWTLTGLWHGASMNFVLWGMYWFVLLAIDKAIGKERMAKIPTFLRWLVTFILTLFGWVLFYYTDLNAVGTHVLAMLGIGVSGFIDTATKEVLREYALYLPILCIAAAPIVPWLKERIASRKRLSSWQDMIALVALTGAVVLSLLYLIGQSYNPFIYFRF